MPLNESFPDAVAFVLTPSVDNETGARINAPIGTGFLVTVPSESGSNDLYFQYLVTAAHVVRSIANETLVRLRLASGGTFDEPIADWRFHPRDDVAVALFIGGSKYHYRTIPVFTKPSPRLGPQRERAQLGDRVYFIGLLADVAEMVARNIPIVRSGTLGALNQAKVPLKLKDGTRLFLTAHLIDCHSYRGFSGSPCFLQQDTMDIQEGPRGQLLTTPASWTELFGLVSGHFDISVKEKVGGDEESSIAIPVNSGVAVVTPFDSIREALFMEELVEDREERERIFRARPTHGGATAD